MTKPEYLELMDHLNSEDVSADLKRKLHRLPIETYSANDCIYFFTICAVHGTTPFTDPDLAKAVIDSLTWRKLKEGWVLYCYCLMPDHLHFVAKLLGSDVEAGTHGRFVKGILKHIGNFKRYTTTQIWWKQGGLGPLWQTSSYDRIIRWDESPEKAVDYVLNNPVRE